jgi:hypothetical protein
MDFFTVTFTVDPALKSNGIGSFSRELRNSSGEVYRSSPGQQASGAPRFSGMRASTYGENRAQKKAVPGKDGFEWGW